MPRPETRSTRKLKLEERSCSSDSYTENSGITEKKKRRKSAVYVEAPKITMSRAQMGIEVGTTSTPTTLSQVQTPPNRMANDTVEPPQKPSETNSAG